ncbi:MAG: cryptochrome/photolyase family protein [Nitrospirota bacterium]|nr:cryptochrome/photolyase family protein [Nitrospirota bacterium]
MNRFLRKLNSQTKVKGRRNWILVLEDQLSDEIGPLSREDPSSLGIVLIESYWKARRRPYHKQKIAFHLLNLRHFALEQAERGIAIRYLMTSHPFRATLKPLIQELGSLRVMEPAELEVRQDLAPLVHKGFITLIPHEGWITSQGDFLEGAGEQPSWRMDAFYRYVRKQTGILMKGDQPLGGQYSFDIKNRKPWKGTPPAPVAFGFPLEPIKEEVVQFVESRFRHHPGHVHSESLPGTKHDALRQWRWAKKACLPHFGPYEDAMAQEKHGLFHTRISALLNIHRLLPRQVVKDVEALPLPLPSKEGFIRQVLGWREFVRHVHRETNGFRQQAAKAVTPGDAGYTKWGNRKWKASINPADLDGGARPSFLGVKESLPAAYWGTTSGLNCLDQVINNVWEEAYSHHITRLMVLSNIATLLDVSPRELTDWFWVAYTDAFDWVVEPNVLAMGTFGTGPLMSTKPYISGASYIHRMSNYCDHCVFDPKTNCPVTNLYWAFLARHQSKLQTNPRLRLPLINLKKRGQAKRRTDIKIFKIVRKALGDNQRLRTQPLNTIVSPGGKIKTTASN